MTAGASGTFAVNGTDFLLPPTEGRWMPRDILGIDGTGHPIYSSVREFELKFVLGYPSHYNQFQNWYNAILNTGTVVADLPKYGDANYIFYSYTGCIIREPEMSKYFNENHTQITLLISNIKT